MTMRFAEGRVVRRIGGTGRVPELDGIRGLAILLVLVWHFLYGQFQLPAGSMGAYGVKLLSITWAGVDLFFVLSGFLIGGILLDNRTAPNYFWAFYTRRVLRIFPLYYASLVAMLLATTILALNGSSGVGWLLSNAMPLWTYVLYLQNFAMAIAGNHGAGWMGITWSLAIEEQFYLLLPVIIRFLPVGLLPWFCAALVLSAIVFRALLVTAWSGGGFAGFVLLPGRWDALFLGVLGAWWVRRPQFAQDAVRALPWLRLIIVLGLCGTVLLMLAGHGIGSRGMAFGGHTLLAILSLAVVLLASCNSAGWLARIFVNPVLVWLGTVSYGVYLLHQPISGLAHAVLSGHAPQIASARDFAITALALALTLGVAAVSWRYFERPLVMRGHRVTYGGKSVLAKARAVT